MNTKTKASAPSPVPRKRLAELLAALVIVICGVIAFHNSFKGAFVYDDVHAIQINPYIRSLKNCFSAPSQSSLAGRPIASLSFALTYQLFSQDSPPVDPSGPPPKLDTTGNHIVNLIIHTLAALTLFGVIRRTLLSPRLRARCGEHATILAGAIALLWVVHPLQTQSVTYIIQRIESLAGLFYLLTLYCSIRVFEKGSFSIWNVLTVCACALGMATKETMATAPLVVVIYARLFFEDSLRACFSRYWSIFSGMAATWFILAALMAGGPRSASAGFDVKGVTPWPYLRTEAGVLLHYIWLSIWPAHLCLDYAWPLAMNWREYVPRILAVAMLLGLTVFGLFCRSPWAMLGVWFFLILAPTSSFVPIKDPAFEQRMYLPLASVIALAVLGAYFIIMRLPSIPRRILGVLLVAGVCILLTRRSIRRNEDYHDAMRMWASVLELRPDNARALSSMGTELTNRGQVAESIPYYERCVQVEPRNWKYWENLGRALHNNKQNEQAIEAYRQALAINAGAFTTHYDMGVIYNDLGRIVESAQSYMRAIQCEGGDDYRVHFNLGNALIQLKRPKEAEWHYRRALELRPGFKRAIDMLNSMNSPSSTG